MAGFRFVLVLLACLLGGSAASAHDPGLSSAHLGRLDHGVEINLSLAWTDLAALTSGVAGATRPDAAQLAALGPVLAKFPGGLVRIAADAVLLKSSVPVVTAGTASATEVLVALRWKEAPDGGLRVEFPILSGMPFGHRMMLTLGSDAEPAALLDARHQSWDLAAVSSVAIASAAPPPTEGASWVSFVLLGVEHILTGYDHLCFLFALLLVATRLRGVLAVVTTFTVAHSLTLAAAALGIVSLPSSVVEPLIAASIIYVGVENIFLRRQPDHRLALVFCFGLIHGLGFASALAERLPGVKGFAVVPPLLGFNAGVELGQLAVAACLVPLIRLARTRPGFARRIQPAFSLMIAMAGFIWLLQRV